MRRTFVLLASALMLLVALAPAAAAGGFQEIDVPGDTAECDFDGDGNYSEYEAVPGQTILELERETDARGITRIVEIRRWQDVEYYAEGASPETVFATVVNVARGQFDGEAFLGGHFTGVGSFTDANGEVVGRFSGVARITPDFTFDVLHQRGECRFGTE